MKTATYDLSLVHSVLGNETSTKTIKSTASLGTDIVSVRFEVFNEDESINSELSTEKSVWGLWDFDVVELFLGVVEQGSHEVKKYFEFQVSPLNQFFELEVTKPRVQFNKSYRSGFRHTASKNGPKWSAEMIIPFSSIGLDEDLAKNKILVGNFFACLGPKERREYFSSFLPKQTQLDFHTPENFKKIF